MFSRSRSLIFPRRKPQFPPSFSTFNLLSRSEVVSSRAFHNNCLLLSSSVSSSKTPPLITIISCASRPDLLEALDSPTHPTNTGWPRFLTEYNKNVQHLFEETSLLKWQFMAITNEESVTNSAVPGEAKEKVIALGSSIPFHWSTPNDDNSLPDLGWDLVLHSGVELQQSTKVTGYKGPKPNALCALAVSVDPSYRFKNLGKDLASELLLTMKTAALDSGFSAFVLPVRPTGKAVSEKFIKMDFQEYCAKAKGSVEEEASSGDILAFNDRTTGKQPWDPWIRKHVGLGGRIVKIATESTTIKAPKKEWEEWTGVDFEASIGTTEKKNAETSIDVVIPGGLVPVKYFPAKDLGVYVEPSVWVRYF
ncbi:hypothetical protein K7432_012279 [Basidiobolus ranarum]|uniref:N-acetyltransferase domain-containing protein n=1 Tax=Basidiobolus ranarum TaxID=34480 RepID=A0ABR2VSH8_9FUNG